MTVTTNSNINNANIRNNNRQPRTNTININSNSNSNNNININNNQRNQNTSQNILNNIRPINNIAIRRFALQKAKEKWKLIETTLLYASFILDARFRNQSIKYELYEKGETCLKHKAGADWNTKHPNTPYQVLGFGAIFIKFRTKEMPFNNICFNVAITADPFAPWRWLKQLLEYSKFAEFALEILKIPTEIGAVEPSMKRDVVMVEQRIVQIIWVRLV